MATANLTESKPTGGKLTIRQQLESDSFKQAIAEVLPKHLTPERIVRAAIIAMTRTPKLRDCDQGSFFLALMNLSAWGLEPDGRRAHLIPFENRGKGIVECQLIIDYKGLAELIMRSGLVSIIHADVVCDKDEFEYNRGVLETHVINFREERGEPYAVYAMCRMKDGAEKCDVMSVSEVNRIRDRSQGYIAFKKGYTRSNPWDTDWNEMAKKTVFRRLSKWLPLSPEIRDAVEHDDDDVIVTQSQAPRIGSDKSLEDLTDQLIGMGDDSADSVDAIDPATPASPQASPPSFNEIFANYQSELLATVDVIPSQQVRDRYFGPDSDIAWPEEFRGQGEELYAKHQSSIREGRGQKTKAQKELVK